LPRKRNGLAHWLGTDARFARETSKEGGNKVSTVRFESPGGYFRRKTLRPGVAVVLFVAALGMFVSPATADPKLKAFGTGDVTIDETNGTVTIMNDSGEYGGVYLNARSNSNKLLSTLDFSFVTMAGSAVAGGAPRFSIPVDDPAVPGFDETYAFLDAANCGATQPVATASVTVSTDSPTCPVFLNTGGSWADWDAFTADHPTWVVPGGQVPFVIADVGSDDPYEVEDVELR
jgi:hypothetical protein